MKINVVLDKRKKGETVAGFPIVLRVACKIQGTGFHSKVKHWSDRLAAPNSKHPDFYFLMDYLDDLKAGFVKRFLSMQKRTYR